MSQLAGQGIFTGVGTGATGATDVIFVCSSCHVLNPPQGFFGTGGMNSVEGETQFFKVTQLRTNYDKVGAFGKTDGTLGDARTLGGARSNVGPQVRSTGSLHDGSTMSPEEFLTAGVFQLTAPELRQVVDFVYAFPSNLAPVVGQQVTLRADNAAAVGPRIDLLKQRAAAAFVLPGNMNRTECELIAKTTTAQGVARGFLFQPAQNNFLDDRNTAISDAALRALAQMPGQEVTFTCVYPGGGRRLGIDRDLDATLDGLEAPPPPDPNQGLAQLLAAIQAVIAALMALAGATGS
jgi:hypothetical protein